MRFDYIELHNFGSYAGSNIFDLTSNADIDRRIVIIGGKNGAGKTTLFTAIQLCLYGHYAFGYKTAGKLYLKEIYNHINNDARMSTDEVAYVRIVFSHATAHDLVHYDITRKWNWLSGSLSETLLVSRNDIEVPEEELISFQNYLLHLVPPEMLKLYFFDGERISDYFLSDQRINIREALMVLSGNDTFDILHSNVKRVLNGRKNEDNSTGNNYIMLQDKKSAMNIKIAAISEEIQRLEAEKESQQASLDEMRARYASAGGISIKQRDAMLSELKSEEERRERINAQRKTIATDILPFIIVGELVNRVLPQTRLEEEYTTYKVLEKKLSDTVYADSLKAALQGVGVDRDRDIAHVAQAISKALLPQTWEGFTPILNLSDDELMQVHAVINRLMKFDRNSLQRYQYRLEKSIQRSKDIRAKLQRSTVEDYEEFVRNISSTESAISVLNEHLGQLNLQLDEAQTTLAKYDSEIVAARKAYEAQLKRESVASISGRVLLLLEDLQNSVYSNLLKQVEADLKYKLNQLMRKADFFDDVVIDNDFNVHILKKRTIEKKDLLAMANRNGISTLSSELGGTAVRQLFGSDEKVANSFVRDVIKNLPGDGIILPVEIDKDNMSSGEKQVFVMSLYWALMQQSENDLPFIIDTPFARIDSEHRANITEHLFMELSGQLFILSTNEELRGQHLTQMSSQISKVFMLEYGSDLRTTVREDEYFEV